MNDSEITEISIEDDGNGYPKDVLSKIGEPYLRTKHPIDKSNCFQRCKKALDEELSLEKISNHYFKLLSE